MNSATAISGSASTTLRHGNRTPHPTIWFSTVSGTPRTCVSALGGFLLPYYHPASLANRVAMLDHLSEGRLLFGVAASGLPSDWEMFHVDGMGGENREMTKESLEIILALWENEPPYTYEGKYWSASLPETMFGFLKPHLKPLQQPHPRIGIAGLSKGSETLKLAGEKGFIPLSLNLNPAYVASHWESVEERRGESRTDRRSKRLESRARGVGGRHR